jgi:hypothetical protein
MILGLILFLNKLIAITDGLQTLVKAIECLAAAITTNISTRTI